MTCRDHPADAEIVGEFGNSYLIDDGETTRSVARTPAYELAYVHGYADLVFGDVTTPPTIVDGPPRVELTPTRSDRVFTIRIDDGRPVQNPPADRDRVLAGVLESVTTGCTDTLAHLYDDLCDRQVDRHLLKRVQQRYAPVPPASVQITDDGWVIEDLFLLTWLGTVYLVTRQFDRPTYRVGGGVHRTDEDVAFIGLTPRGDPDPFELPTEGDTLAEREMRFLAKAAWLASYRDRHDDDLFWELIERHVQTTRAQAQTQKQSHR